jgi:hypothetical protein
MKFLSALFIFVSSTSLAAENLKCKLVVKNLEFSEILEVISEPNVPDSPLLYRSMFDVTASIYATASSRRAYIVLYTSKFKLDSGWIDLDYGTEEWITLIKYEDSIDPRLEYSVSCRR